MDCVGSLAANGSRAPSLAGRCPFADTSDPDYQRILALCRQGKTHLETIRRFDMPRFRPTPSYVREMKRFGIVASDMPDDAILDTYSIDEAYWQSHWWSVAPHAVR